MARFVYASKAHVPDYVVKGDTTYRVITDYLGSVRAVVNTATGEVVQKISYDEFGVIMHNSNPGFQPFAYVGGLYDTSTELVRFGARDYDAGVGRWTAKDAINYFGTDANLYTYVWNEPINWTDILGHSGDKYVPDTSGKHGGPHVDRYKGSTNVGRYRADGSPIPHKGKIPKKIPKSDFGKFANAAKKLSKALKICAPLIFIASELADAGTINSGSDYITPAPDDSSYLSETTAKTLPLSEMFGE